MARRGFTTIEAVIAVAIVSMVAVLFISKITFTDRTMRNTADKMLSDFVMFENTFYAYLADFGTPPAGFADPNWVGPGKYVSMPTAPLPMDQTYGVNGYSYSTSAGTTTTGYYVTCRATTNGTTADPLWKVDSYLQQLAGGKYSKTVTGNIIYFSYCLRSPS